MNFFLGLAPALLALPSTFSSSIPMDSLQFLVLLLSSSIGIHILCWFASCLYLGVATQLSHEFKIQPKIHLFPSTPTVLLFFKPPGPLTIKLESYSLLLPCLPLTHYFTHCCHCEASLTTESGLAGHWEHSLGLYNSAICRITPENLQSHQPWPMSNWQ